MCFDFAADVRGEFCPSNVHRPEMLLSTTDLIKLVINVDRGQWSHLAHGTTVLLHSRGVHRYTGAFDHAMLESQLSVIVCTTPTICTY